MQASMLKALAAPVPRYTSYPTALQFAPTVDSDTYYDWLGAIAPGTEVSLYLHIPFCHSLCFYCGCNTKATLKYKPVAAYLRALRTEIVRVADRIGARVSVRHMHWGGGSPNVLEAEDLASLATDVRAAFRFAEDAEFAIEIDPRHFDGEKARALTAGGVTRVSVGVQDFEPAVQRAINRVQTFAQTQSVVALCRAQGIRSINVDLIYGLPEQTCESVARTVTQVIELAPDRLAVFGYAHLPQRLPQQRMIVEAALPDIGERLRQASLMAHMLQRAGYERVGLDHFAKSTDALAHSRVSRNFQGYTTDSVETLIGFGASSIGRLRQGYVQNATAVAEYMRRIETGRLAVAKGCAFSVDDRVRGHVIERLMCDLAFDRAELRARFGSAAACAEAEAEALMGREADGLLAPTSNGFKITEKGRPFVRSICAAFDAYLEDGNTRHSAGV